MSVPRNADFALPSQVKADKRGKIYCANTNDSITIQLIIDG